MTLHVIFMHANNLNNMYSFCTGTLEEPPLEFNLLYLDPDEYLICSFTATMKNAIKNISQS